MYLSQHALKSSILIGNNAIPHDDTIDVRSLQDRVHARIKTAMRKGVFTAGQTLTIRALAARFGTSEMPVREAIKRLVAEKALIQRADRTFQIPNVTSDRFQEMLLVRTTVEGRAAELAAMSTTPELTEKMRIANELMLRALSCSDHAGILEYNQDFHFLIYQNCGNQVLLEIIEMLWTRNGPYLASLAVHRAGINAFFDAAKSHARILSAVEAGDGPAACRFLQEDIKHTAHWFWTRAKADGICELSADDGVVKPRRSRRISGAG